MGVVVMRRMVYSRCRACPRWSAGVFARAADEYSGGLSKGDDFRTGLRMCRCR